ncbi:Yqey-like protein [bacterium BMS3Bbin12]|nr:Yqey-like protein [bacterium BMS3Abin12]GBE47019.1 Yqey-like protein [bacterium BMS3Bbin12]GBE50475.1 Yqey-like protein [bacterium BMS3Bbin13]
MAATSGCPLRQRVEQDMKDALRARDRRRLGTIRLVLAALKQREIDERIQLDDAQVIAVLDRMIKQRRDSVVQYEAAGRQDLADQESYEIGVIREYLPPALGEAEIDSLIEEAIAATGAAGPREMGKVMGYLKPRMQGRADLGAVSARVKVRLAACRT